MVNKSHDDTAVMLRNVSKHFGEVTALNDVSFTVNKGEIVALLGPNGAGKTTAISLMLGLRKPTYGDITLFGEDPRTPASHRYVASMLQESKVPDTLHVREVIELFKRLYMSRKTVEEALKASALESKANSRVGKLSGGERQRLYFALCVVADAALLFLDEPTVAMDVESRRLFWEQVESMSSLGKTIVLTTHYLEEADALANRVIVINHGKIIAQGTPSAIKSQVNGKFVRFHSSNLKDGVLSNLVGVHHVKSKDDLISFRTFHPEQVLQQLFAWGVDIKDLEVNSVGLEEAFVTLTSNRTEES
ncbi:ABC transporter ATP-binding protein [Alicyclobacillus fodiniaquatilis]|uniref:ABC transporter ATP-binding protein n=1 Tax=Alicyclobacillus fodiniaquatilis TaxID=1661150 RepID=A0ABW4JJG3_9BACL